MNRFNALLFSLLLSLAAPPGFSQATTEALADEGERLAALLRVGRRVVSNNQTLINDPDRGDKGLDSAAFLAKVDAAYRAQHGQGPLDGDLSDTQRRLTEAQLAAMATVLDENQELINSEGLGFKGFIPAIFGRLVNEQFAEQVGSEARLKVTAPMHLVRNRKARPDDWEAGVFNGQFSQPDWPRSQAFFETVATGEGEMFRMLIPEYYGETCLTCHGGPKGEVDVTGFPKEGAAAGDLAGAISITLKRE
ncbi:DUF3365 domain-containing protein [Sulfitobacter aestuarii]|uniref:DUF3365 domain-containing protein n=1 Tax=Sulfitobacter aestuarii TaxID=2161676 RepID=A0ABW5U1L2_9RHOB